MKVIVNTGFGLKPAGIEIVKNEQRIMYSPMKRDCWVFGANAGDRIEVRLKFAGSPRLTVASFVCQEGKDTCYVYPARLYKRLELASFKILPCLCLLLFVFRMLVQSEVYYSLCVGMIVLTALSLIILMSSVRYSSMRKKLFKFDVL
mgnify:FL=1